MTMSKSSTLSLLAAFLLSIGAVYAPASDTYAEDADSSSYSEGFSKGSIKGTFYIPCGSEGNIPWAVSDDPRVGGADPGSSIHVNGMGKAVFDGKGKVTITQWNVYTEIGGVIVRNVMNGKMVDPGKPPADWQKAQFSGRYKVNAEGFGQIYGDMFPPKDDPNTPSFLITETSGQGKKAKALYIIFPQNFVDMPDPSNPNPPKTLIHVTAKLR